MRLAQVVDGAVVNVIEIADDGARPDWCADWPEMGVTGGPGWSWDGQAFTPPPEVVPDMAACRAAARARINAAAGAIRSHYITDSPGMAMVYLDKEAEARRWIAAGTPADLTGYVALQAEVGVTAPDAVALAALWLDMAAAWRAVSAQIEAARMAAMAAVAAAQTPDDAMAAEAAFAAATAAL